MRKGKYSAKGVYRKKRLRWDRIIGVLLIFVAIIWGIQKIQNLNIAQDENLNHQKEPQVEVNAITEEKAVLVEREDEEIKTLIEQIKLEKGLNESNFSFFYYNINQKAYYFYNQDTYFTAASTIKMPIAMAYYDEVNTGNLKMDSTLTYKPGCYQEGNGKTAYMYKEGSEVPLQFLIKEAIINSDNTATAILRENWGYKECRCKIAKYSEVELPEIFYDSNITSAKYGYDVVRYLYENQQQYEELIGYLKQSSDGQYLKKYIDQYDVAHKYGSFEGCVHDYGIVYTENPYLIGVFTKGVAGADELIAKISKQVLEINI